MDLLIERPCSFVFMIKVDRCGEDEDRFLHNLLVYYELSESGVWRNFFSSGIHVSGRTKDVSVFQNQVVLDLDEKTSLIQVSLTGDI